MKNFKLKNVLVPLDFSPISQHALRHAVRIGELTGARITLLHVVEPYVDSLSADSGMVTTAMGLVREMEMEGSKKLQRMARRITKRNKVLVRTIATIGRIAPTIKRVASRTSSDLILMGTHGVSGFVENLMGSNTYRVATLSRIPVLSVHKAMRSNGYSTITYPVRDHARAMDKFPPALAFAKLFKARVHIVGLLLPGERVVEKNMRTLCTVIEKRFSANGVKVKTVLASSQQPADAIIRYAQSQAGSLVVINQDYDFRLVELFRGTFTKRILHKILSPVLIVPR